MAGTSRSAKSRTTKATTAKALKGDLPERFAEAEEKGYFGHVPDANPNSAYSLEGGPPTASNAALVASGDKAAADSAAGSAAVADASGASATDADETDTTDGDNPD